MSNNLKVYGFKVKTFHACDKSVEYEGVSYMAHVFNNEVWAVIKAVTCGMYDEGDIITFYDDENDDIVFVTITCLGKGKMSIDSKVEIIF